MTAHFEKANVNLFTCVRLGDAYGHCAHQDGVTQTQIGEITMLAKTTTLTLVLVIAAITSAAAAPRDFKDPTSGWHVGTDPSSQIRNYLQHDRGAE